MANVSEFDYEKVGFDVFMERNGGLYGDPEMAISSVDLGEKVTKEIEGWDLENLRIESWIKSRNYKPQSTGFMFDGKTGKIECRELEVTSGKIRYNKTSFSDSVNEGYWIGNEGVYFGAAADATKFKFTIATGIIEFVGGNISNPVITGIQSGSEIAIQGWQQDMTFSATDYRTVAWASGTITLLDGTTYAITEANTGNMINLTYIYLDIGISTTALQTTTIASDAIGSGKILIAVAEDNSDTISKATLQVFGGKGGNNIMVDNIAANSASVNEFISNSAQIANAIIGDAHITGTITVGKTDAKCTNANADQTSANGQGVAWLNEAVGSVLPVANTDAKCTNANADQTSLNTAADTAKVQGYTIISGGLIATSFLSATNIVAGTMNAARINSGDINGVTITGVTITGGIIKTASVNKRIELNSTGNLNEIAFYNANNTLSGKFYGAGTEIQGGPWLFLTAKTYIDGEVWIDGTLKLHGSGDKYLYLRDPVSTPAYIKASSSSPYNVSINRSWLPISSSSYDLGSSSYKWRSIYLSSTVYAVTLTMTGAAHFHGGTTDGNFTPSSSNTRYCGTSGAYWARVYSDAYFTKNTTWQTGWDKYDDLQIIRDLKTIKDKKRSSGYKLDASGLPKEIYDNGFTDFGGLISFNLCASKKIVECVDDLKNTIDNLKNRLKILETKTI